jgi:PTH1 family peptidyl-tRNA hydrolase
MKLIIGLGNPGANYERTRHNIGFRVVDKLASKMGWKWNERRAHAVLASGTMGSEKVILAKPITYMNRSGESVGDLMRWYKLQPSDILVVYDELDLPLGRIRLRAGGSAAGHNGLDNIIRHLHTNAFPRLRVGIGHPTNSHIQGRDHVLGVPPTDERILIDTAEDRAVQAIELILTQGLEVAMNTMNADPEEQQRKAEEQQRKRRERAERLRLQREAEQKQHTIENEAAAPSDQLPPS